jgi:uncharacterized protein (DUF983 family)
MPSSEWIYCPKCNNGDTYKAYIEDGSFGDWCPHCNMSIKKINGLIK